ncbi:MAG TPA: A/G-specific adenine glycosylase [Verrucomicrobiae bacterium]|nr:A/G-specific adenine glycosylase [Verrucomicrobiae bacterium]
MAETLCDLIRLGLATHIRGVRSASLSSLSSRIVSWYGDNARDLPWRRTRDPYAIWISEVMLQQTQVKTVIPYWEHWMHRFPTLQRLAQAKEEAVLKAWEGLGYYSRARNLLSAARLVCQTHQGEFPREFEAILALPGIGRYTAGAICSIAFSQAAPILDGNVARVLARVFVIEEEIKSGTAQKELWRLATALVQRASKEGASSELNQGLMELGATVCLPRQPQCQHCPIRTGCGACKARRTEELPRLAKRPRMKERFFAAFVLRKGRSVLLRKRARNEVNGGLWEFPNLETGPLEGDRTAPFIPGVQLNPLTKIRHTIMNQRITVEAFTGEVNGNADVLAKTFAAEWHPIGKLKSLPFTGAHARLRELLPRSQFPGGIQARTE